LILITIILFGYAKNETLKPTNALEYLKYTNEARLYHLGFNFVYYMKFTKVQ